MARHVILGAVHTGNFIEIKEGRENTFIYDKLGRLFMSK